MKIQKRIIAIIGIVLIAAAYFFYSNFQNHDRVIENSSRLIQTQEILKNIDSTYFGIAYSGSNARSNKEVLKRKAIGFSALAKINTKESVIINDIVQKIIQKINSENTFFQTYRADENNPDLITGNTDQAITDSLKSSLRRLKEIYSNQLINQFEESKIISQSNFNSSIIIGIFVLVLIGVIFFQVSKFVHLRKAAEKEALLKEIKYREFFEDSGLVLLTIDLRGNISFVNKRAKHFTGFEPEEIIGKHFSSLVDEEWIPVINNNFRKQLQNRDFELQIEFPLKDKAENRIWVEQSSIILFENDIPKGFQCLVKDITEKKKLENEARKIELERKENQYQLQSILDNTPLIIYIKDLDGRYLLLNKKYKDFFQYTDEQAVGKSDFDLLAEDEAQRNYDIDQYVIREGKSIEMEVEADSPIDGKHNLLLVRFPLFDRNQNVYGIGGIATDITERLIYSKHLMEAKAKAELAEQLQEQFLANMSHEIRTPMNGIIGMTNILIDSSLSEEQKEFVQVIKKSSDNLLVLINDILDLSKIKAGKLGIESIDFHLRDVVETTIAPFKTKILEKGIRLVAIVDYGIPDLLVGDPHRLTQILTNLMSNAIKFTEQGEINLELKLKNRQPDEVTVEFSVSDTGIGISNDKLQYIFESFTQAETGITRRFGGTGLGLSITKKLIELQNGAIDVRSKPDQGTTFTFVLNYGIAKTIPENQKQQLTVTQENGSGQSLAGKKILVVEDNETNRKVIYHMLKKVGIVSTMACDGKEAIKMLEDGSQFDLIIMDLQMPEMNGFETTRYIRTKMNLNIPIIAMTASALRNEKTKCLELGMNEYLTKPFVPAELYKILKSYLLKDGAPVPTFTSPSPSNGIKTLKPYNLDLLKEMDDPECLCEVLRLFLESAPLTLNEISLAIVESNWEQVYKQSHKLKSSLGLLQLDSMLSLITKIEANARDKNDLTLIPEYFIKTEILFEKVKPMIEEELKNASELPVKN